MGKPIHVSGFALQKLILWSNFAQGKTIYVIRFIEKEGEGTRELVIAQVSSIIMTCDNLWVKILKL